MKREEKSIHKTDKNNGSKSGKNAELALLQDVHLAVLFGQSKLFHFKDRFIKRQSFFWRFFSQDLSETVCKFESEKQM